MKKRILALALCLGLLAGMVPAYAFEPGLEPDVSTLALMLEEDAVEAVELPEKQLRVYGAGFTARHERPLLEGFRAKADGWTNLMVLHGDATQAASPYNPITPEQLAASGLAYLALGHIHQASGLLRCGSTCYAWPGCAMGRGFDELGQKGAYLGEVSDSGVRLDFLPLHGRSYEILRVEAGASLANVGAELIMS